MDPVIVVIIVAAVVLVLGAVPVIVARSRSRSRRAAPAQPVRRGIQPRHHRLRAPGRRAGAAGTAQTPPRYRGPRARRQRRSTGDAVPPRRRHRVPQHLALAQTTPVSALLAVDVPRRLTLRARHPWGGSLDGRVPAARRCLSDGNLLGELLMLVRREDGVAAVKRQPPGVAPRDVRNCSIGARGAEHRTWVI